MSAEDLAAKVQARIEAFAAGDYAVVLDPQVLVEVEDLLEATADHRGAIPSETARLAGLLHWHRYQVLPEGEDGDDIDEALGWFAVVAESDPDAVPKPVMAHLINTGMVAAVGDDPFAKASRGAHLYQSALHSGDTATLAEAIGLLCEAVDAIDEDQPDYPEILSILGAALHERFDHLGDRADIDEAVAAAQRALDLVDVTCPDRPDYPNFPANLGTAFWKRHDFFHNKDDLEQAVQHTRAAVAAAEGHRNLVGMRSNLAMVLRAQFVLSGNLGDLNEAVTIGRGAVADTAEDDPDLPRRLTNLETALHDRYEQTASDTDLAEALEVAERAVDHSDPGDPDLAGRHSNLSLVLRATFERFGDLAVLDRAVDYARQAAEATDTAEPDYAAYASNLASTLCVRFERHGKTGDIDDAVTWARSAVQYAPDDYAGRHRYLMNLGVALRIRFEWLGDMGDLGEAVDFQRLAADSLPEDDLDYRAYQCNLGIVLQERFSRTGDARDLKEAIGAGRASVTADAAGDHHPNYAVHQSNLGNTLLAAFESSGEVAALDEAIDALRETVEATPDDNPDLARRMSNLGLAHWYRFEAAGRNADLNQSLARGEQALARTAPDHPNTALYLANLSVAAQGLFEHDGSSAALDRVLEQAAPAIEVPGIAVRDRVSLAGRTAHATAERVGLKTAMPLYRKAIELMPRLVRRDLATGDQLHLLDRSAPSLGRDAAACAVATEGPELALTLLEQGRGVIWGSLLDTRTDFVALRAAYPETADEIERCRSLLDAPRQDSGSGEADRALRWQASDHFDELVEAIRGLPPRPGFTDPDRFLQPPSLADLLPPPGTGPVVVLNVSRWRCDALVVTAEGVEAIELGFTEEEAAEQTNVYLDALHLFGSGDALARVLLESETATVLRWLWDAVAEPVLDHLGYTGTPSGQWPRLWWCPTGPLTLLPLHAAGYHTVDGKSVLDRVVSSYTPTLRSLAHARSVTPQLQQERMLIATVPNTPESEPRGRFRRLDGAKAERELLRGRFNPSRLTDITDAEVTHAALVAALRSHRWVHLACHGEQDLDRPTTGGLVPFDWHDCGLVGLNELTGPDGIGGEFAFLSACQTATGGTSGIDEAVNLASAMQYAGWQHVIGTLWTVGDDAASFIAQRLYTELVEHGRLDADRSPYALHRAVRELRVQAREHHSLWGRFIHLGP